jgi:hypothetical protein
MQCKRQKEAYSYMRVPSSKQAMMPANYIKKTVRYKVLEIRLLNSPLEDHQLGNNKKLMRTLS